MIAETKDPTATDNTKNNALSTDSIAGKMNIPPCGAGDFISNACVSPPAIALPITDDTITLNGSFAANGIAPSVINDAPKI